MSLADTPEGEMAIDEVLRRLSAEKAGILNWLIAGALQWLTTRVVPQSAGMADVLSSYWAESSPLIEWMGEWCDTSDPAAETPARALYNHFKDWCERGGIEKVMTEAAFGRALSDKQHLRRKDGRGNIQRQGIRLRLEGMFSAPCRRRWALAARWRARGATLRRRGGRFHAAVIEGWPGRATTRCGRTEGYGGSGQASVSGR